jgi:hypothetical protein
MKPALFFIILLTAFSFNACDDYLDSPMKSDYAVENYYTSQENAEMALSGVYYTLYNTDWWLCDVASDDAVYGNNGVNFIDNFTAKPDDENLGELWGRAYSTISQANNVIAYTEPMDIPLKSRYIGEAKFLRAFSYFWLVNLFGEVPYKDRPQTTAAAIHVGLSSADFIYSKMEGDLRDAAAALPVSYAAEQGRITKGTAFAMLAKVYIFQKKYADCLLMIDSLETLHRYALLSSYEDLFKSGAEDSTEVIWGLRFGSGSEFIIGNRFSVCTAPPNIGGWYFDQPTQSFVDCFTEQTTDGADDPRLDASIGRDGKPWFDGTIFSAEWSATGYIVKKYLEDNPGKIQIAYYTVPYHYLRWADVLLMKAEALNELSRPVVEVVEPLNEVRRRAHLADVPETESDGNLRRIIRLERRRELGFECHRFFDIMRYGKDYALDALATEGLTWRESRFCFPIPQAERDANEAIE